MITQISRHFQKFIATFLKKTIFENATCLRIQISKHLTFPKITNHKTKTSAVP